MEEKGRDTCGLTGQMCPLWTTITLLAQHCTRISRSLHSGEKLNVIMLSGEKQNLIMHSGEKLNVIMHSGEKLNVIMHIGEKYSVFEYFLVFTFICVKIVNKHLTLLLTLHI